MELPPIIDFRNPAAMTPQERRAEMVAILSCGLSRFVAEKPVVSPVSNAEQKSCEMSLNQLDPFAVQSVYAVDENA